MTETLSDAEKFKKQLRLIVLLTNNAPLSVDEISRQLHMSRRSTYRYIEELRKAGFILKKSGTRYFIDHHSPLFYPSDAVCTLHRRRSSHNESNPQYDLR